ncbi:MAG: TonB-dependent receptor [Prevotellaceae bacterium]|jgi:outer membrane cobalamin receptor|nr:TonB-dependent receptor [Prevotellaceae bacterium]
MFSVRHFTLVVGLVLAVGSTAQSKLDSVQLLEEFEVVADRYREVIPSQRLSGVKLEALSSFSVADAIRYFSGVQIKDYGGIGGLKTVDIRSMGSNHLGVFYDGIEIGNAQNGTVDLGKFSLDFIEEVSLYNGQKSEIFQSAKDFGSAGTVYLRTRRPKFTQSKQTNLISYFRTGSFDLVNPSVLWEQKINKNISSSLNAEYVYSSGKYKYRYTKYNADGSIANDTTAVRQNGDIHSLRLEGGFNGYLPQGHWNVKGYLYDSEKGLPGAIVNNVWKNSQRQWDRNAFVQGSFQKQLFNGYDFLVNAKYSNDYMRYQNPDTTLMLIDNKFRQQEIYVSTANKYSIFPTWDVNLSVDYSWNTLDANLAGFVNPSRNTVLTALATAFEWRRLKAQASLLGTFVFDDVKIKEAEKASDKSEYTPAVFLSYQPFVRAKYISPLRVRAFYKRIFRMPTFNDLYYTDIGNIKLRPEFTTQYNLGIQYGKNFKKGIINDVTVSADAYYNEVIDKIVAVPKGGSGGGSLYRWMMMNLGLVEIRGVDVAIKTGIAVRNVGAKYFSPAYINLSFSYTCQKAQDFTDKNSEWYGGQIAYIPWHSGSAIVNTQWRTWDLNYSFIYVGERYHNSANIPANHEQPWYTHDLTLGKSFKFRKSEKYFAPAMKISAEINNLLNQAYEVITCYPMPGRNYKIILKMEI